MSNEEYVVVTVQTPVSNFEETVEASEDENAYCRIGEEEYELFDFTSENGVITAKIKIASEEFSDGTESEISPLWAFDDKNINIQFSDGEQQAEHFSTNEVEIVHVDTKNFAGDEDS